MATILQNRQLRSRHRPIDHGQFDGTLTARFCPTGRPFIQVNHAFWISIKISSATTNATRWKWTSPSPHCLGT